MLKIRLGAPPHTNHTLSACDGYIKHNSNVFDWLPFLFLPPHTNFSINCCLIIIKYSSWTHTKNSHFLHCYCIAFFQFSLLLFAVSDRIVHHWMPTNINVILFINWQLNRFFFSLSLSHIQFDYCVWFLRFLYSLSPLNGFNLRYKYTYSLLDER